MLIAWPKPCNSLWVTKKNVILVFVFFPPNLYLKSRAVSKHVVKRRIAPQRGDSRVSRRSSSSPPQKNKKTNVLRDVSHVRHLRRLSWALNSEGGEQFWETHTPQMEPCSKNQQVQPLQVRAAFRHVRCFYSALCCHLLKLIVSRNATGGAY